MRAAEKQLATSNFLLGDRPTALDCIVLGGLRAHTLMDPDPAEVMQDYPNLMHWANERADTWDGSGSLAPANRPTDFARAGLREMSTTYQPWVLANAAALAAGAKACTVPMYDESVSYLTRPYPERSRSMVIERINRLSPSDRRDIEQLLADYGLMESFSPAAAQPQY